MPEISVKLKNNWQLWLGIGFTALTLGWLIFSTDWAETWRALQEADYIFVMLALLVNLLSIPLRTRRWQSLFPASTRPAFGALTSAMLIGQAINTIAPARLGDVVRASLVKTESTTYVLGTLVLQTVIDLLMVAGIATALLFQIALPPWWQGSGQILILTAFAATGIIIAIIFTRNHILHWLELIEHRWQQFKLSKIIEIAENFLRSFDMISRPIVLFRVLAWSIVIWLFYGMVNYILMATIGTTPSILAAFFLLVVLQLGVAIPSSPGRIGVYHYLCVLTLGVFGVNGAQAVSYAIILHLISVIVPIAIGAILASRMGVQLKSSTMVSQD